MSSITQKLVFSSGITHLNLMITKSSSDINWQGGGFFKYQILEQYEDTSELSTILLDYLSSQ